MRKGSYGLSGLVRGEMGGEPMSSDVFIFISKRRHKIKLLQWDTDGFALYEKRLEKGSYERPVSSDENHFFLTHLQLQHILQGVVLKTVKHRKRYAIVT